MKETKCFIDSDVIVNAFVKFDERKHRASQILLEKLEKDNVSLVTDYFVFTEVHYVISRYKGTQKASEVLRKLLTFNNLEIIPIDHFTFWLYMDSGELA